LRATFQAAAYFPCHTGLKPAEALCFARAAFQAEEVSLRNRQDHDHPHFFCVKVDFTLFAGFLCWLH